MFFVCFGFVFVFCFLFFSFCSLRCPTCRCFSGDIVGACRARTGLQISSSGPTEALGPPWRASWLHVACVLFATWKGKLCVQVAKMGSVWVWVGYDGFESILLGAWKNVFSSSRWLIVKWGAFEISPAQSQNIIGAFMCMVIQHQVRITLSYVISGCWCWWYDSYGTGLHTVRRWVGGWTVEMTIAKLRFCCGKGLVFFFVAGLFFLFVWGKFASSM